MKGLELLLEVPPFKWLRYFTAQTLLIFLAVSLLVSLAMKVRRTSELPPGPPMMSFAANIFTRRQAPHLSLTELSKKYGNLFTCYMFCTPVVVINGFEVIQEALVQQGREFAGRPYFPLIDEMTKGQGIIMAPYGRSWKQQRRFTLTALRNFGLGKIAFEEKILQEAQYLTEVFKASIGQPFNPNSKITSAVSNVICSIVLGKRFHYEDEVFTQLVELIDENMRLQTTIWAQEQNSPNSCLTEGNLMHNVSDLFVAGTETTTTTLQWAILYMMAYPDIQERCQKEIDQVIGWSRTPSMEDAPNMPYVNAVVHEVQRFGNVVPLAAGHAATRDTSFRGYTIKKGTMILINMPSVLSEETQWKDSKHFNPGNFLNENGEFFKPDAFIPFSMGLRACPGEKLARMELFLFFASLLQNFEFYWPDKTSTPDLEGVYKLTLAPRPYEMAIRCRKPSDDEL
ncbi:cytochrome P450 2J2-like isoform X2 [Scyliorhinus canicula]|uniref:cytochrome P450 2J2-like isoform X2 n=1 Tax=Scyliorhinus canicula TaxID=7830 RepID=UPI0018F2DDE3|nr:cytochrome P450 2J2-like isoform X2 [Scyliorhinus canicula]